MSRSGATWTGHEEYANTDRLLGIHADFGVQACFAVVGGIAHDGPPPFHNPTQVRRIYDEGHEVASHGMRHEWIPGLGRDKLRCMLRESKDTIEQRIGDAVTTFVPPFNQPFDYPRALSWSISERKEAGPDRIGFATLCRTLRETGYSVVRGAYRGIPKRLLELFARRRLARPSEPRKIEGVVCVKLTCSAGFDDPAQSAVQRAAAGGQTVAVYGHPHSISYDGAQSESNLIGFLECVRQLRDEGSLMVALPRDLDN